MIGELVSLLSGMGGRNDSIDDHRRPPFVYSWSFLARVNSIKRCIVEFGNGLGRCHRTIRHSELARIVAPRFSSRMPPATWLHFVYALARPHDKIMNLASTQGYNPLLRTCRLQAQHQEMLPAHRQELRKHYALSDNICGSVVSLFPGQRRNPD